MFREGVPGEVSPVFEDQTAFYMMELVSSRPASIQPLESARATIEQVLRLEAKVARAEEEARELLEQAREAGTLEVLDNGDDLVVQEAGPAARMEFFPGLGVENPATGLAFGLELDEIGGPVATENNVYLVQTLEKVEADSAVWEEGKDLQRARLAYQLQQQRLDQWLQGLREVARIVDRREEVFQTPAPSTATGGMGI